MRKSAANNEPTGYPEYAVRAEVIGRFFDPPLASSTFHDLVKKGKIVPLKDLRGFYKLNDSLRRLHLREVQELPTPPVEPGLQDITRLGFTFIDPLLFPAPQWTLAVEVIDPKTCDHALRVAEQHRASVEALDHVVLKLAYFQGVLDVAFMIEVQGY
jgi:hypothetical protein